MALSYETRTRIPSDNDTGLLSSAHECPCNTQIVYSSTNTNGVKLETSTNNAKTPYMLPNSSKDGARLEQQAKHLCAIMNHQPIHAPVPKFDARAVLDVGCGTGFVTDTMANRFPNAIAYGLDLSPAPDVGRRHAENVRFLQGNILDRDDPSSKLKVDLPDERFDLIFSRLLIMGLTDWDKYISTTFSLLRPGGWVELHEIDYIYYLEDRAEPGTRRAISNAWPWVQRKRAEMKERGLDPWCGSRAAIRLTEAGFDEVIVKEYYWPFGGAGEESAEWKAWGDFVVENIRWASAKTFEALMEGKASEEEIQRMKEGLHENLRPEAGKRYKFYVTCGRKPMVSS